MKIKSRRCCYLARERENYKKSKNSAANRSQQQGQNRVANRKTHPKVPNKDEFIIFGSQAQSRKNCQSGHRRPSRPGTTFGH